uniref:Uncharacterized protein n=1 Tax=Anguilla anguilla TaxID=7936 RepID=A0A0E9RWH3_ANGAN
MDFLDGLFYHSLYLRPGLISNQ